MRNFQEAVSFSPIIVGTMRLGKWGAQMNQQQLQAFVEGCLEMGLRDFDHADIYGHYTTEADFGQLLTGRSSLREQMQITTKCGIKLLSENRPQHQIKSYDSSKAHIIWSVEQSLRELSTDYVDVLLLHRPDYLLNPHEVAEAFTLLKESGKVRAFGVSNYRPSQFDLLHSFFPLITNQIEASILQLKPFQDGTLDQCLQHSIIPTAWSPIGGGRIFTDQQNPRFARIRKVAENLQATHHAALDQILLAWLMKHPAGIIPVIGTSKLSRVQKALEATNIQLSHEEWYMLWEASTGQEVP